MAGGPYHIEYAQDARDDLRWFTDTRRVRYAAMVRDAVEAHLRHEPTNPVGRRKAAAPNSLGAWRLRADPLRVYYDVSEERRTVYVRAVIYKERNRTYRRGQEIDTRE